MNKSLDSKELEPLRRRRVEKYLLPNKVYEHDLGSMVYVSTFIIEWPYLLFNKIKDAYYHLKRAEHSHC